MRNSKKTICYYLQGYGDGKRGAKKVSPTDSGMARRLYNDGYKDAKEGKVRH
jgi:hypothetical protein